MAQNEIHVGDIGTVFQVTVLDGGEAIPLQTATTKQLIFTKPSREKLTKAAAFVTDGSDGKIKHTSVSGDLDESGNWKIQAYIVLPGGSWKSDIGEFFVHPNL